ncbi:MAG: hypothetical protein DMD79_07500, partial [Candidatus Rokuibacteriota bacterium]
VKCASGEEEIVMKTTCMRTWSVALILLVLGASPALSRETTIEATAPLAEHSEAALRTALMVAIGKALTDAKSQGVRLVRLDQARVEGETVRIRVLATDDGLGRERTVDPLPRPHADQTGAPAEEPRR